MSLSFNSSEYDTIFVNATIETIFTIEKIIRNF